jgi:hypothetical protein
MLRVLLLLCSIWFGAASAQASNISPLAFGMTADEAAAALGTPLIYVKGRPGAEVLLAERNAGVPGFYPARERIFLQFRRGGLTGWKKDWAVARPGWLF